MLVSRDIDRRGRGARCLSALEYRARLDSTCEVNLQRECRQRIECIANPRCVIFMMRAQILMGVGENRTDRLELSREYSERRSPC